MPGTEKWISLPIAVVVFITGWMVGQMSKSEAAPSGVQVPPQHFKCYLTNGKAPGVRVVLEDQFRQLLPKERFDVGAPRLICTPAVKRVIGPPPFQPIPAQGTHLKCYQIEGSPPKLPRDPQFSNQLGREPNTILQAQLLCVPSAKDL